MKNKVYLFSTSSHPDAIHIQSLDITFLQPEIDFSHYDYLIVTSKQVSKALIKYDNQNYKNKRALCISSATATSYEALGGKVLEVGYGYGDNLYSIIQKYPKETRWLYLRAKEIASDFVRRCKKDGYAIDEKTVYESVCSKKIVDFRVQDKATLIFTSPSSVKCFLKNNRFKSSQKVIVIGKSTANAVPKDVECIISKSTTIESCLECI